MPVLVTCGIARATRGLGVRWISGVGGGQDNLANVIQFAAGAGQTGFYALLYSAAGQVWNGFGFEVFDASRYATYVIAMTESGAGTGLYQATMPAAPAGTYRVGIYDADTGSPAQGDVPVGTMRLGWDGQALSSPSDWNAGKDWAIQLQAGTGQTGYYAILYSTAGQVWNRAWFETFNASNFSAYVLRLNEVAPGTGLYQTPMPPAPAGTYGVAIYDAVAGSPAQSDPTLGELPLDWDGSKLSRPGQRAGSGFEDGLNSVVQVELDQNAAGAPGAGFEDSEGGPEENYQPIPGFRAIPCRIIQQNWPPPTHMWTATTQSASNWHKVLFAGALMLNEWHRLRFVDPATNNVRFLYVMGQAKNAHQMNVFSRADCLEYAL